MAPYTEASRQVEGYRGALLLDLGGSQAHSIPLPHTQVLGALPRGLEIIWDVLECHSLSSGPPDLPDRAQLLVDDHDAETISTGQGESGSHKRRRGIAPGLTSAWLNDWRCQIRRKCLSRVVPFKTIIF